MISKALYEAIKIQNHDLVIAQLQGIDILTVRNSFRSTLLHLSAACGNATLTKYFIERGLLIDAEDADGNTPLLLAVYFQRVQSVRLLLDAGADLLKENNYCRTPMFYSRQDKNSDITKMICETVKLKQIPRSAAIKIMMDYKWQSACRLHRNMMSHTYGMWTYNDIYHSSIYKEHHVPVNFARETPFIRAMFHGDRCGIRLHLHYGAEVTEEDGYGCTPLHAAAILMDTSEDAETFLRDVEETGASIGDGKNSRGITLMHVAFSFRNMNYVRILIRRGVDINVVDDIGRTPLYCWFLELHERLANAIPMYSTVQLPGMALEEVNDRVPPPPKEDKMRNALSKLVEYGADITVCPPKIETFLEMVMRVIIPGMTFDTEMLRHLAMAEAQGKTLDHRIVDVIRKFDLHEYYDALVLETKKMKEQRISDRVTFFDVAMQGVDKIALYVRNRDFVDDFKLMISAFPMSRMYLERKFDEAVKIMQLERSAIMVLTDTLPFLDSYDSVIRIILSFMTKKELQHLTQYCKNE